MATANTTPSVSTMIRTKLPGGRLLGVEGDLWIVRKLPLEPVADAKSVEERMNVYMPLMAAYEELAAMATTTGSRRSMSRGSYRQHQLLMVNLNKLYNPSGHKIAGFLKESFPAQVTEKRIALLAVRLVAKVGANGGWQKALDSVVETLVSGGTPLSDFDDDYQKVDAALARSGLSMPTAQELSMANSWWNQGEFPDTVDLAHDDHLHLFADTKAVRMANDAGREDCTKWPRIPKHHALTFATLEDFNFEFESSESTAAHWATGLVEDGAVAISIRGSIEPAKVTRAELRRQRKRYMDDINERHKNHKMEDARQEEMLATLEAVENVYASGGSPTLVDASVLVAFNGEIDDIAQVAPRSAANLRIMNFRQRQALAEMMLCSSVRANPNLHDLPIQTVACSGIQSLSLVGDKEGALLGFTERDSQPAYESPTAASSGDAAPIFVNLGATGSGKTMVLLWKALQFAKLGGPQVIIDPKALALDTPIPTPTGWTTMGDIQVGDQVIGRDGVPCNVVHKSRIFTPDETHLYEFVFDDGQVIRADQNHMWVTAQAQELQGDGWRELTTENMLAESAEGWLIPASEPAALADGLTLETRRDLLSRAVEGLSSDGGNWLVPEERSDVVRLARSLGIKVTVHDGSASFPVEGRGQRVIRIKEIRPVESAEAQCIRVDSPDHTYLVGDFLVTHNTGSDHSPTVLAHGGQVASLDDLKEADGIFDPLRFSHNPTVGVELAVSMLASIDPWGGKASEYEVKLYTALSYGVSKGANCVGQALRIADADGKASRELVDPIFELADTSPLFRACVGVDPHTKALSINEGITLIKVGNTHLDLPEPGAMKQASVMQKVSLALVRMMVFGSAMALTGRGGAIHLDEAWVFLGAGKAEVERLGRLARSQQVLPELYTQRASDPLKAGLAGYISRGLILPIEDKDEARAALELFKLEPTDDRLSRITGKAMVGEGGTVAPNWNSMRALRDPVTKKVLRGTVGFYSDLAGRCVPVQIVLPPEFLKLASTNADDLNERKKELALAGV